MVYDLTVNATYNKNCEYRESTVQETLPIINELQQVTLLVLNTSSSVVIGEEYTLIVKCILADSGVPIKKGYITINDLPTKCYLNNDGRAEIKYTPLEVGEENIIIKYNDVQGLFESTQISTTINVAKIKTSTEIIEYPDTIADYKEAVTIKAKVTKANSDDIVTYGRVTFLHYLEHNVNSTTDRIEKIIGNPVYLNQNGEATITYVPMQEYSDDIDLENNEYNDNYVEYIKAVYNYEKNSTNNNNHENAQWHYYGKSDDFGCIHLKRPNSAHIKAYDQSGELSIEDYIRYTTKDEITFKVSITDENEHDMSFSDNDELILIVSGTASEEEGERLINKEKHTCQYDGNTFSTTVSFEPGFYDIYAQSYIIHTDDGQYLQSIEESMHYYLQVDYESISIPLSLHINGEETSSYSIKKGDTVTFEVYADITTLSLDERKAFRKEGRAQCTLNILDYYVPFVQYTDSINKYKATLTHTFTSEEDCNVYAFTKEIKATFRQTTGKTRYINVRIPKLYTPSAIIYVSGKITPSISSQVIKSVYPGEIQYTASLTGVRTNSKEGEVLVKYNGNNKSSTTYIFDRFVTQYTETLSELNAGEYQIFFNANSQEEHTSTMEVEKATIIPSISQSSVLGIPNTQQSIDLSSNGDTIDIDPSHIHIKTKRKDEDEYTERPIIGTAMGSYNNILTVLFPIQTYTEDTWNVYVDVNDDNYKPIAESLSAQEFTTTLYSLTDNDVIITEDSNNNITIHITNPQVEYIPLIVELVEGDDPSNKLTYICVTDSNGNVSIPAFGDKILWNNRDLINISINPTHEQLINAIRPDDATYESLQYDNNIDGVYYGEQYFEENIEEDTVDEDDFAHDDTINNDENTNGDETTESDTTNIPTTEEVIFTGLRNQLINYESKYLFTYYKASKTSPMRREL